MKPTLLIAVTDSELVLLGTDDRVARRPRADGDDIAVLLADLWQAEFPDERHARLLLASREQPRKLATAARRAGGRILCAEAWNWNRLGEPEPPTDDDWLAELAPIRERPSPGREDDLLARPHLDWRPLLHSKRFWMATAAATAGAALAAFTFGQRAHQRTSREEAAERAQEEFRAESAAAGRRQHLAWAQAEALYAAASPSAPAHAALLRAISSCLPPAAVLDSIDIEGPRFALRGHCITGAPGADNVADTFRHALFGAGVSWHPLGAPASLTPGRAADFVCEGTLGPTDAPPAPRFASAQEASERAQAALVRLPDAAAVSAWIAASSPAWTVEAGASEVQPGLNLRRFILRPIDLSPAAWPRTLELLDRIARIPGATLDTLQFEGTPAESGAFSRMQLQLTLRIRA